MTSARFGPGSAASRVEELASLLSGSVEQHDVLMIRAGPPVGLRAGTGSGPRNRRAGSCGWPCREGHDPAHAGVVGPMYVSPSPFADQADQLVGSQVRLVAEDGADDSRVLREPPEILRGARAARHALWPLTLDLQQLAEQRSAAVSRQLAGGEKFTRSAVRCPPPRALRTGRKSSSIRRAATLSVRASSAFGSIAIVLLPMPTATESLSIGAETQPRDSPVNDRSGSA